MNIIKNILAFTLIFMINGLISIVYAHPGDDVHPEDSCHLHLPDPIVVRGANEDFEVGGKEQTRYRLSVTNLHSFPNELFRKAPNLPPCGSIQEASRTRLEIHETGKPVVEICDVFSIAQLTSIEFIKPRGAPPPEAHIHLIDRSCEEEYSSNTVQFGPTFVDVDCSEGESLSSAISRVNPFGTVNVRGTCEGGDPIVISKSMTLKGVPGGSTTIVGRDKSTHTLTATGANQINFMDLNATSGKTGFFYKNAGGSLVNVNAHDNVDGIVIDESSVNCDDVNASDNDANGITVRNGSRLKCGNQEPEETLCPNPEPNPNTDSDVILLFSTISSLQKTCSVVANNNGTEQSGHGILVDGDVNTAQLDLENCTVEISGLNAAGQRAGKQGTGLEIINGGNVTTLGSNLTIKGHIDGVLIEGASTLDLNAFSPEAQSTIVSDVNTNGLALIESAFIIRDQSEVTVSNNTESGVFLSLIQLLACDVDAQFKINNSGLDLEIEGVLINNGKVCALQVAETP